MEKIDPSDHDGKKMFVLEKFNCGNVQRRKK